MSDPDPGDHRGDLELARAVLDGDAAAFHKLFDLYGAPVLGFARRARADEGTARALTGEILRAVFSHLDAYSGRTALAAWVLATARLVARGAGERARRGAPFATPRSAG